MSNQPLFATTAAAREADKKYVAGTYARFEPVFVWGKGSLLFDHDGRRYIDLGSGIAVNAFGVSDDCWQQAVCEQAGKLQHISNLYYTEPQAKLAELLCARTGMDKVFFSNSGAEANECAIKTARKYSFDKYGGGRHTIVTLDGSFHGRTMATLSATGQPEFHRYFDPFLEGFVHTPPNDIPALERTLRKHRCCAVMIEMVQGEGGVNPLEQAFVDRVAALADEQDLLLIVDEVQTGNGRCGALYCYMDYGIRPDVVSTAKGLAGGLPFGATLLSAKAAAALTPGSHATTFGGNPVCAAAAISVVTRLDDALLDGVRRKETMVRSMLEGARGVAGVSGRGLMLGVSTTRRTAREVVEQCLRRGVVLLTAKEKVRLLPALNIPDELLEEGVAILKEVVAL